MFILTIELLELLTLHNVVKNGIIKMIGTIPSSRKIRNY